MTRRLTRTRFLAALTLAGTLAVTAAACGDDDSSSSSAAPDSSSGGAMPDKITIGYQLIPNGDLVVKNQKYLEDAFGKDVTIDWKLFDSGGAVNEAVLAGGVDFGLVGSSPTSRGISTGIEYQVPWIFDVIGKAEALVVKEGITSFDDLKGKTIATPFASTAHFSLLAALQENGLTERDVKVIDAEPDAIYAAWTQGDIDGAYVWNPNLAKMVKEGGTLLITSEDLSKMGKTTYDLGVVTNSFAEKYPGAVDMWVEAQDKAVQLIQSNPDEAAKAIATELTISPEDAKAQMGDLIFLTAAEQATPEYLGGGLATNLYAAAQFNKELGKIKEVQPESAYQEAVVETFAKSVAGG